MLDKMPADVLETLMLHLQVPDALAAAAATCTATRNALVRNEKVWQNAATARWALKPKTSTSRWIYGERTWREVYRVFHRRNRMPSVPSLSERALPLAHGASQRVHAWLVVTNQPACRLLAPSSTRPLPALPAKLVVQNISPHGWAPRIDVAEALSGCVDLWDGRRLGLRLAAGRKETSAATAHGNAPLAPLECRTYEIEVDAPLHMSFEPELLEAARRMIVRLPWFAVAADGHCILLDEICCRVSDGEKIWSHYEMVNSQFYCYHDEHLAGV